MKKQFLILALSLSLTACTSGYHSYSGVDGYKSKKLTENSFFVSFLVKYSPTLKQAEDFALFRSAELCKSINSEFFTVKDRRGYGRRSPYGGYDEITARLVAVCHKQKPKTEHYNVSTVEISTKSKYAYEFQ